MQTSSCLQHGFAFRGSMARWRLALGCLCAIFMVLSYSRPSLWGLESSDGSKDSASVRAPPSPTVVSAPGEASDASRRRKKPTADRDESRRRRKRTSKEGDGDATRRRYAQEDEEEEEGEEQAMPSTQPQLHAGENLDTTSPDPDQDLERPQKTAVAIEGDGPRRGASAGVQPFGENLAAKKLSLMPQGGWRLVPQLRAEEARHPDCRPDATEAEIREAAKCSIDEFKTLLSPGSKALLEYLQHVYGGFPRRLWQSWDWSLVDVIYVHALPLQLQEYCKDHNLLSKAWRPVRGQIFGHRELLRQYQYSGAQCTHFSHVLPQGVARVAKGRWVEIMHYFFSPTLRPYERRAFWMYRAIGSGIWFWTGLTLIVPDHVRAGAFFSVPHGFWKWAPLARMAGFQSIEFTHHSDGTRGSFPVCHVTADDEEDDACSATDGRLAPYWPEIISLEEPDVSGVCPQINRTRAGFGPYGFHNCNCTVELGRMLQCEPLPPSKRGPRAQSHPLALTSHGDIVRQQATPEILSLARSLEEWRQHKSELRGA